MTSLVEAALKVGPHEMLLALWGLCWEEPCGAYEVTKLFIESHAFPKQMEVNTGNIGKFIKFISMWDDRLYYYVIL